MTIYKLTQFERGMGSDFDCEWYFVDRDKAKAGEDKYIEDSKPWRAISIQDFVFDGYDGYSFRGKKMEDDGKFYDMWNYYSRDIGFSITPITVQE